MNNVSKARELLNELQAENKGYYNVEWSRYHGEVAYSFHLAHSKIHELSASIFITLCGINGTEYRHGIGRYYERVNHVRIYRFNEAENKLDCLGHVHPKFDYGDWTKDENGGYRENPTVVELFVSDGKIKIEVTTRTVKYFRERGGHNWDMEPIIDVSTASNSFKWEDTIEIK